MTTCSEKVHIISIYNLIEFSIRECIKREQRMRTCSYCGKYFATHRRNTAESCNLTIDESVHTYRGFAVMKRWAEKKNSDEDIKEYRRECKKRYNWIKAGKIKPSAFYTWSATAKGKRTECIDSEMPFKEFKKKLSES